MVFITAETFGQYLRELRKKRGLTLKELGEEVGFSYSYLSQIERGERGAQGKPSPEVLKLLSKPLKVDLFELMEKAGYFEKGTYNEADKDYNLTVEDYINTLYKRAEENPDAEVYSKIVDVVREYIPGVGYDDTAFSIIRKIKDISDLHKKEELIHDLWGIMYDVSQNELDYILQNEDLTYNGHPLNKHDRLRIRAFLDGLISSRLS